MLNQSHAARACCADASGRACANVGAASTRWAQAQVAWGGGGGKKEIEEEEERCGRHEGMHEGDGGGVIRCHLPLLVASVLCHGNGLCHGSVRLLLLRAICMHNFCTTSGFFALNRHCE
jgi:hypothetical protein